MFIALVNAFIFLLAFFLGELAVRWHREGGFLAAIESFFHSRTPSLDPHSDTWFLPHPELGYTLNPQKEGINSLGLRHRELSLDKPEELFRVIVLGDSVAWDEGSFVELLGERMGRLRNGPVEVINASIPGYTTYQERLLLERNLLPLQPSLVIVQYCLNDNHRFLHRIAEDGNRLLTPEARRALLPQEEGIFDRLSRKSYLLVEIRRRLLARKYRLEGKFPWENMEDFCVAWQDKTWPGFKGHLQAMRDRMTRIHGGIAVIAVPFGPQLRQDLLDLDRDYTVKPQRLLSRICLELGVPFLDLFPPFLASGGIKLFRDDIHLTPAGHEIAARELFCFLERERLLSPE